LLGKYAIISGGVTYRTDMVVSKDKTLHYKYGSLREARLNKTESDNLKGFLTCNLLIKKKIFLGLETDNSLKGYGHEDTFMFLQAKSAGYHMRSINNPVYHEQLHTDETFINNQGEALQNLSYLYKKYQSIYDFRCVRLISLYKKLSSNAMGRVVQKWLSRKDAFILEKLKKTKTLMYLDLWKLAYFSILQHKNL
jgi:hypothetical protein